MQITNKKKALVIALVLVGALIVAVYALWAVFLAPPNNQDFADAKVKAEQIKKYSGTTLLTEFNRKVVAQSKTGLSGKKLVESASSEKQKTIDALNSRVKLADEVGQSRVLRDKEVKNAYDTYRAREASYSKYIRDYLETYPTYSSLFTTCSDVFEITKKTTDNKKLAELHSVASKDCIQNLDSLAKSPITPFSDYAKEFKRIVVERQKLFDGIKNKSLSFIDASARIKELGAAVSQNDPTDDIIKYGKKVLFKGELNKLIAVLEKKA